jgi:hypothetical protein
MMLDTDGGISERIIACSAVSHSVALASQLLLHFTSGFIRLQFCAMH